MSIVNSLNILVGMDVKDVQTGAREARAELRGLAEEAEGLKLAPSGAGLKEAVGGAEEVGEAMEEAAKGAERWEKAIDLGKDALKAIGITISVEAAIEGIRAVIEEGERAEASLGRLEAVVDATGNSAGMSAAEMREFADSLDKTTKYGYLEVEQMEALLATNEEIGSAEGLQRATKAAADMAAMFGGTQQAATAMNRALADPEHGLGGLSRAGVVFSASEKELIADFMAAGRAAEAHDVILGKIEHRMGGTAERMQTAGDAIAHSWDGAKRAIYEFFSETQKNAGETYSDLVGERFVPRNVHAGLSPAGEQAKIERPADLETKAHREARQAVEQLVTSLRAEADGLKQTAAEATIAKAQAAGLTEAELAEARAAQEQLAAHKQLLATLADQKKQTDALVASAKQLREHQAAENQFFGMERDEAELAEEERKIDARLSRIRSAARAFAASQAHGGKLDEYGQATLDEYNELKRAKNDLEKSRVHLGQRREKETDQKESQKLDTDLKALRETTRTPKEQIEAEMAELKALYDRANEADARNAALPREKRKPKLLTEERQADFVRKRDALREKYAALDKKPEKKAEHQETPALLAGSAEAFHAVARFQNPTQSVEKQSLQQLRDINRALHEQRKQDARKNRPQVIRKV